MMHSLASFLAAAEPLAQAVNTFARTYDAQQMVVIDHFCYKCGSHEEYLRLKEMLSRQSRFVNETLISGRMIATIGLNLKETRTPLAFSCAFGDCFTLELSDQKPNNSQVSGFDHIEVLPVGRTYHELKAELEARGVTFAGVDRPHHATDDHALPEGYTLRLTREPLLGKIADEIQEIPWE